MSVLNKYQRHPKHYISLPSNGYYYKEGDIELSIKNELPVRAMTAKDELLLKNPEALLNGDSIARVIQSCCPEIKMDIRKMVAPDVEVILLAILSASYDDILDFESTCPECENKNEFQINISKLINQVITLDPPFIIKQDIEGDDDKEEIKFYLSPYTYEQETNRSLMEIENNKMFQFLGDERISEDEKLKRYADSFNKMIELNFHTISDSILKIETPDGSEENKEEIKKFTYDLESEIIQKITQKVNEINLSGIDREFDATCQNQECKHQWKAAVEFDPARFFAHTYKQ